MTESRAAAVGGTTTVLNYMRTGQYYLNQGGPYADFFPQVLDLIDGRSHVDYAFHLAPMQAGHIDEIPLLIERFGVTSFKIFMFYGAHGLHGRSSDQAEFLMTPPGERYDLAHFEFVMRGIAAAAGAVPGACRHHLPVVALRDGGDHGGLHQAGGGGRLAHRAARLPARPDRPTPRAWP